MQRPLPIESSSTDRVPDRELGVAMLLMGIVIFLTTLIVPGLA